MKNMITRKLLDELEQFKSRQIKTMTNTEINKLKVGDKIRIRAFHSKKGIRYKGTRIIRRVLNHKTNSFAINKHLSVNRIIVKCFNESYMLTTGEIIEKVVIQF